MKLLTPLLLSLSLFAASAHASTVIMIADNFGRLGTLAGSQADIGGNWGGSTSYTTNTSSGAIVANSSGGNICFQAVTFLPNSIYTLSVSMTTTSINPLSSIGFGFGGTFATGDSIMLQGNGLASAYEAGLLQGSVAGSTVGDYKMVLTTTGNPSASKMNYFRDGTAFGPIDNPVDSSGYNQVFLTDRGDATGSFVEFSLTGTVPEPSSLLLFSVAGLGLMRRRR